MTKPVSFSLVAGEASGDLLAGLLLGGLKQQWPDMHSAGIGGPRMAQHGFQAWWPYEKLAVRGYVEVMRHYREIVGIRAQLKQRLLANPPSAFIGVDAPDFNLDLERDLKAAGIPAVHFVCPSIWAWRADRVEKIRQSVDHVLCIFPFETELLAQHGIASTYVGHPLAQTIPDVITKPRRARNWVCRRTPKWWPCCRAVAVQKFNTWRNAFCWLPKPWQNANQACTLCCPPCLH